MGAVYAHRLKSAAQYAVELMSGSDDPIRYSAAIYDGEEELSVKLQELIGLREGEAECVFDVALGILEDKGYVRIEKNGGTLFDGEKDFDVSLTEKGKQMVRSGELSVFQDVYL